MARGKALWPAGKPHGRQRPVLPWWAPPAVAEGRFAPMTPRGSPSSVWQTSSLDHDNPLEEVYEDQLMSADLVVLNKADLADKGQLEALKAFGATSTRVRPAR